MRMLKNTELCRIDARDGCVVVGVLSVFYYIIEVIIFRRGRG